MNAAWALVVAESVGALAVLGTGMALVWRTSRRIARWRRRKRREEVYDVVIPVAVVAMAVAGLLFGKRGTR